MTAVGIVTNCCTLQKTKQTPIHLYYICLKYILFGSAKKHSHLCKKITLPRYMHNNIYINTHPSLLSDKNKIGDHLCACKIETLLSPTSLPQWSTLLFLKIFIMYKHTKYYPLLLPYFLFEDI